MSNGLVALEVIGRLAQKGLKVKLFEANGKLGEVVQTPISMDTLFTMVHYIWLSLESWNMSLRH
ncbi:MAG TPA: hypothetical protein VK206_14490 [Anaerolineales bacterium]|nr:hypothetical protein [Anaerolineales bacterium]